MDSLRSKHRRVQHKSRLLAMRIGIALIAAIIGAAIGGWLAASASNQTFQQPEPQQVVVAEVPVDLQCNPTLTCGNGRCDKGVTGAQLCVETCGNCPQDCGSCTPTPDPCLTDTAVCGDGVCAFTNCEGTWNCPQDCTACGDNICNTVIGDCKEDCPNLQPTTAVFVASKTPTPTATATLTATATRTPTNTRVPTRTATARPTSTDVPVSEEPQGCGLVSYESRETAWKQSYGSEANAGSFVPDEAQDREVWVCPVPPSGEELCIPTYRNLLKEVDENPKKVRLADCDIEGNCTIYEQEATQRGDQMCFVMGVANTNPTCEFGCALLPDAPDAPFPWWILLLLLLLLLVILFILMQRRKREQDEAPDEFGGLTTSKAVSSAPPPMPTTLPPSTLSRADDIDDSTIASPPNPPDDPDDADLWNTIQTPRPD